MLNNYKVKGEITIEMREYLEINENTSYQNIWDTVKAILRGEFITINV